jgi:hypothetical protein
MRHLDRKRIFTILLVPLLLIPLASLAYAHFTDQVVKKYKIHVAWPEMDINSYKVLCKWNDDLIETSLVEGTLTIQTRVFPGWYAWIGLVIHNSGIQPVSVQMPSYDVYDPDNVWEHFVHTNYFYGPYEDGGFAHADPPVWGGLKWWQLPPEADPTEPPVVLEPCHKLIIWTKLEFNCPPGSFRDFEIEISIRVLCIPELEEVSSWWWGQAPV